MSVSVTPEQQQAIESRGKVIVSASAGSGKTFVMIERLVSLILRGADVKNVLSVTFTNKAAAQMKDRLRLALIKQIGETTDREQRARFKSQLNDLPLADISTIHSFCARLVRTHFYIAEVDPAFRIISPEDAEGKTLSARAAAETFETAYEEGGEEFARLLAVYFRKKKDARLRGVVLDLYKAVRGSADYRAILEHTGEVDLFDQACGYLFGNYRGLVGFYRQELEKINDYCTVWCSPAIGVCADLLRACGKLLDAENLFAMTRLAAEPLSVKRMPQRNKYDGETLRVLNRLSSLSKSVKTLYGKLNEYSDEETERLRYRDGCQRARALASLALVFDDNYTRLKREAGVLDYNDLEHYALKVLLNEDVRREVKDKYKYVFVDEYQDVNPVQEKILSLAAGEELFLVGDAKQAIYGFRGSRSEYFLEKERSLENSLRLTSNFRSAPNVLKAVNRVFEPLIGKAYAPMSGGGRYGDYEGEVRFHSVADSPEDESVARGIYSVLTGGKEERTDALAEKIADLVEREYGAEWYDADEKRPEGRIKRVGFGDVAVLARKNTGDTERIVRALSKRGIPVTTSSHVNVCDTFEARLIIDWLSFLDNAEQDIPFATALLSAIGGFTEEELARVRLACPRPYTFREACRTFREEHKDDSLAVKLNEFEERAQSLRTLARVYTAEEMINTLLTEGLEAQIAAKQDGKNRLARVRRLCAEAENAGGVHEFLARLKASDFEVEFSESGGDFAVKVLTMHASKGLEYPVVILAGLDANFHGRDTDDILYTERFGAAPRSFSEEDKLVHETVLRRAAGALQEEREVAEERNLLYVAMTRAKCRLHLCFGGAEPALSAKYARRFSDFFDFDACADYFAKTEETVRPPVERRALVASANEELTAKIRAVYEREYPYAESAELPVKSSATALMRSERESEEPRRDQPSYQGAGYIADTGTAYHLFLQHVTFGAEAKNELARIKEKGLLSEEQAALLSEDKLTQILNIPCLKSLASKRVRREQTFLVNLPANEILGVKAADEIVFQGAIDLLCEDENGCTIVDYKFSSHDDERIRLDYASQIRLYKKAVARIKRIDERNVKAVIVNIARCREIPM